MTIPTTMRAVKVVVGQPGEPNVALVPDAPVPQPGQHEVLVRVHAAGLNPSDWKHATYMADKVVGATSGLDFAGEIVAMGKGVTKCALGDRVLGAVHGSNPLTPNNGAFSEYVVALETLIVPIPDDVTYESAAGQAIAAVTTAQMLWQSQALPTPQNPGDGTSDILVWSGATSVGQWLIQIARLSGLRVIATTSPKHTERLKRLGASEVIDYRDPEVASKIRAATNRNLRSVAVCESSQEDFAKIVDALSDDGGALSLIQVSLKPENINEVIRKSGKGVQFALSNGITLFGKAVVSPISVPAKPEHAIAAGKYAKIITDLLREGKIELVPVRVVGGLEKVWDAMEDMRLGKVSGERIVFKVVE